MKLICLNCKEEKDAKIGAKYCSNACQKIFQFVTKTLQKFYKGDLHNRRTLITVLTHLFGYRCVICGNDGIHSGLPLSLQLDHIDGNSDNDMPENVRLLCPNCHSQTPTFTAKNKGNGRRKR